MKAERKSAGRAIPSAAALAKAAAVPSKGMGQKTLLATVANTLRSEIVNGQLAPGSKLSIWETTERLGVSLSITREALSRLTSEGLVTAEDHKGYSIAAISIEDLEDLTQLRMEVTTLALRDSMKRGDAAWEARILSALHILSRTELHRNPSDGEVNEEWADRHRDFHFALISACRSGRLLQLHNTLFEQSERYRRLSIGYARSPSLVHASHEDLVQPVLAHDVEAAVRAMRKHIEGVTNVIIERSNQQKPAPSAARRTVPRAAARGSSRATAR